MVFDGSEKFLGCGTEGKTFLYHGYVYKIFIEKFIDLDVLLEKNRILNELGLTTIKYYDVLDSNIIVMDYVEGYSLEKCLSIYDYRSVYDTIFDKIHNIKYLDKYQSHFFGIEEYEGFDKICSKYNLSSEPCLCHFDLKPNNIIMKDDNNFEILDWTSSRFAHPIFDYMFLFTHYTKDNFFYEDMTNFFIERLMKIYHFTKSTAQNLLFETASFYFDDQLKDNENKSETQTLEKLRKLNNL